MTGWRETRAIAAWAFIAVLASGAPSAAQIYKWVDEKGTVHFSNDPPAASAGAPPVEVLPDTERRPAVRNEPASPGAAPAPPESEATYDSPRRHQSDPAPEDVESEAIIEEGSDTIIVDEGVGDPVTRYRANSPRNRPGQPIRQPSQQPRRRR